VGEELKMFYFVIYVKMMGILLNFKEKKEKKKKRKK